MNPQPSMESIPDDSLSLSDIALALASHARAIIVCSMLAALLPLAYALLKPQMFESTSMLRFTRQGVNQPQDYEQAAAMANANGLLRAIAPHLKWIDERRRNELSASQLKKWLSITANKRDSTVTIITYAPTPQDAHDLNRTAIDIVRNKVNPTEVHATFIQQKIDLASSFVTEIDNYIKTLSKKSALTSDEQTSLADLLVAKASKQEQIINLQETLRPYSDNIVIQQPRSKPKTNEKLYVLSAVFGLGVCLMLSLVFLLKASFDASLQDKQQHEKWAQAKQLLRKSFFLK